MKEFKEVKDTKFEILVTKDSYIDEQGRTIERGEWKTIEEPVNIGSFKNPNPDIKRVKWTVPKKEEDTIFGKLLK